MAGTLLLSKEANHIYKPHEKSSGHWQQVFGFLFFGFFSNSYVMDGTSLMNAKKYCKMKTC